MQDQKTKPLQYASDQTVEFMKTNGMAINPNKTHNMVHSEVTHAKITIDGKYLERISSTNLVCVFIQSYLKYDYTYRLWSQRYRI